MPLNKDDLRGGLKKHGLSREDAKAHVAAYRATRQLPSSTFADPVATLPATTQPTAHGLPKGLVQPGNIDLHHRPVVSNQDDSISTVRSISIGDGKHTYLIPTVVGNRVVSNQEAINHFRQTGEHLGAFSDQQSADRYAQTLHGGQAKEYLPPPEPNARRSRTTAPPGSAQAALIEATGGSYAFDRPAMLRPEDIATVKAFHRETGSPSAQLDFALGFGLGVKPSTAARALQHPLRFAEHNRKQFEQSGYRSAGLTPAGLITAAGLFGSPAASSVAKKGAAKGLETRFAGGAASEDAKALPVGAAEVTDRLAGASKLRTQQEKLYSVERSKRIAEAERLMNEVGGEEGHALALKALKGDLPKLEFTAGTELSRDNLPDLFRHIQEHPALRPYERLNTRSALLRILEGKVPTKSEIRLLGTAFGEQDAQALAGSAGLWRTLGRNGLDLLNVPRALTASFDLSAPFRQGLVLGARHPAIFASEFKPMLKAFKSESAYLDVMDNIATRPTFKAMQDAKLALTDLENLSGREESFMSNLAERIPVVGHGVRASGRAYVAFLNKFRADAFDHYMTLLAEEGRDGDPEAVASIARWINHATGRGSIKSLEGAMVPLNSLLFSPRLIASRVQLLNPGFYATLDPFARKQALRGMAQLVGGVSLTLYLAKAAGAKVGVDPRSADFGKIKVGNTRIDIMGGFQQYLVLASRLVKGESVNSSTGEVEHLTGGFGKSSRGTLLSRFAQQKLGPVPGAAWGALNNENFAGQPWKAQHELPLLFAPLGIQNAVQTYTKNGPAPAAASAALGSIGFGVNTYGPKADADFKDRMKVIDQAVKAGQLSPERAAEAKRDLERIHHVQTHDTKANRRQFLIDSMRDQGYANAEINAALHQLGYDPVD